MPESTVSEPGGVAYILEIDGASPWGYRWLRFGEEDREVSEGEVVEAFGAEKVENIVQHAFINHKHHPEHRRYVCSTRPPADGIETITPKGRCAVEFVQAAGGYQETVGCHTLSWFSSVYDILAREGGESMARNWAKHRAPADFRSWKESLR